MTAPLTPETVRRWLRTLHAPDKLGHDPELFELLARIGRVATDARPTAVGRAAATLLRELIDKLRPERPANRQESVPYDVAKLCFVENVPLLAAADRLGMSARQLTRERARAVAMVIDELTSLTSPSNVVAAHARPADELTVAVQPTDEYQFEPVPAISGFLPRPQVARALATALDEHRLVHVHGPAGGGKTSLVADLASSRGRRVPTLWYRVRPGVNDSLPALLFELGQHMRAQGREKLAATMGAAMPVFDASLLSRIAIQELSGHPVMLVVDDFHVATGRRGLSSFLEDVAARIADVQLVTVGRSEHPRLHDAVDLEVPPLTRNEIRALLRQLGDRDADDHVELVHHWTHGVPYLVQLAASWLATADPTEVGSGGYEFSEEADVQVFLLDALTALMETGDRQILDAASVFRARFTDPALAYVADRTTGQVADTSRRLVTSHLASRSRQGGIALFCEVLREYVYQRLDATRRHELHTRAAEWYRNHARTEEADYHGDQAARLN